MSAYLQNLLPFGGSNYASFGEEGFWLPELAKINIFIGKNNTGKTNILKFIHDLHKCCKTNDSKALFNHATRHWDIQDPTRLSIALSLGDLGVVPSANHFTPDELKRIDDTKRCRIELDATNRDTYHELSCSGLTALERRALLKRIGAPISLSDKELIPVFKSRFHNTIVEEKISALFSNVFMIPQFREFRYDSSSESNNAATSFDDYQNVAGYELARRLAWMKSPGVSSNSEQERFEQISSDVREMLDLPDLEIEFEDPSGDRPRAVILKVNGLRRYLESFGTGIHQLVILCFALSLKKNACVCIEEPEIFLHPGLQRNFFEFLRKTENTYFISTHSNVFLDCARFEDSRVYHVSHRNMASEVVLVDTSRDGYNVLDDLGCHASDIMQANGVIWVEGPTDRLLLLKWLSLRGCPFKEGVHFSIMFYGGKLLTHLTVEPDAQSVDGFISLLRINRHAILMLDSDRPAKGKGLKQARKLLRSRFESEMRGQDGYVWVTQGKEVENYLSERALTEYCNHKWKSGYRLKYDNYKTLDTMIRHGKTKRKKFCYSANKVKYCREIIPFVRTEDLGVLNLKNELSKIISLIEKWNPQVMSEE